MDNEKRDAISDEEKLEGVSIENMTSEPEAGSEEDNETELDPEEIASAPAESEGVEAEAAADEGEEADAEAELPGDTEAAADEGEEADAEAELPEDAEAAADEGEGTGPEEAAAGEPEDAAEALADGAEAVAEDSDTPAPETEPGTVEPDPEKIKRRRLMIGCIAGITAAAVIIGSQVHRHFKEYYTTHFFRGTVISGMDVSKKTVDEVKAGIEKSVSKYSLKIRELERDEKITAEQIGLEYVDDGKVDELMEDQEEGKWFLHLMGGTKYDIHTGTKFDEGKMTETLAALECFKEENVTKPQDAALKDENSVITIQDEVEGNEVNLEKLTKAVTDAIAGGKKSIDIVKDDCYNHPSVYRNDENLKARMDKWNEYLRVNVTYAFGDNIETVNAETVKPNVVDDGTNVDLPTDWIRSLVYGWGQKYDTFGLPRPFTTHSGQEIMIEGGGDYGWVINKDEMIADVTDAIFTGAQGERTTTFLYSAMGWDNGDLTGTYVEVSIAEQHLWCYKDYELVMDTDVVTGLPTAERATTPGCFAIDAKKEDATLGSLDVQGYESPVNYWAPFNGGQGLHDAPWRGSFGGDIYLGNGSHGCVNIPPWNMETIYNAIEIGNAVVIY